MSRKTVLASLRVALFRMLEKERPVALNLAAAGASVGA